MGAFAPCPLHGWLLDDSFDGIIIADEDGTIEMANGTAGRLIARDPAALVGQSIGAVLPGALAAQGGGVGAQAPREIELKHTDGGMVVLEHATGCSQFPGERKRGRRSAPAAKVYIHTFRDVTERRDAEAAMREAMNQALAASRAKSEFLANMSHELRTPLNAIIGFADMIKGEILGSLPNKRYREYAADIGHSGTHLLEIINDILDLSKIEAGEFRMMEEPVGLADIIHRCLRIVGAKEAAGLLQIRSIIAPGLPPVMADPRLLRQAVLNLLSNAVKFTPAGGNVTVSARIEHGCAVVRVADTGIGIASEQIAHVVKPFYQVKAGLDRKYEGTGLGLALVSNHVGLHGGEFRIDSRLGAGTTATIRLPASRTLGDMQETAALARADWQAPSSPADYRAALASGIARQ